MSVVLLSVLAPILLLLPSTSAQSDNLEYTVWSSVIISRTGERTPEILGDLTTQLTSLGAQQQYATGQYFRQRYLTSYGSTTGIGSAPIQGMSPNLINNAAVYVEALDEQFTVASAQAFMQGLYPPYSLSTNGSSDVVDELLDPTSVLANDSYIENPLNGYQYAQVHTTDADDIDYVYLSAQLNCPAWDSAAVEYSYTSASISTSLEAQPIYDSVGDVLLVDVLAEEDWGYGNAYAIYDYLNYQNAHNSTAAALLDNATFIDPSEHISYLNSLRWYADQQQYAWLANLTASNNLTGVGMPSGITGSISTIAGNLLAAKILAQLQLNIVYSGDYYKLSVLFTDYQPLMSLFALTSLPTMDSNFYGLPAFASVAAFELFSYTSSSTNSSSAPSYPDTSELYVRFWFRNGTGAEDNSPTIANDFISYSLFNRDPEFQDMSWDTFQNLMSSVVLDDAGDWCSLCGSNVFWCAAWNASDTFITSPSSTSSHHNALSPAAAGAIGAAVTLVIAGLAFVALMFCAGVRFHRVPSRRRKSDLGGFKGNAKLASDRDLTLPKSGGVVVASETNEVEDGDGKDRAGHERIGSWELRAQQKDAGTGGGDAETGMTFAGLECHGGFGRRPSFEDDDALGGKKAVEPSERV